MELIKKSAIFSKKFWLGATCFLLSSAVFADDKLAGVISGDMKDMLGSGSTFWKLFILVDVVLSAALAVKSKNPMVFLGVFSIALIPGFLINSFVF